jgi:hypothetical protein
MKNELQSWRDPRLSWNPADFDNITQIRFPSSAIWRPDIQLFNK